MTIKSFDSRTARHDSPNYRDGRFRNLTPARPLSMSKRIRLLPDLLARPHRNSEPDGPVPVQGLTREQLLALPVEATAVIRLGHSSILLKINGRFWLIDPVFSERASPLPFAGPRRFHRPPITIDELPDIDGVLISHNHYDHLDEAAIRKLHPKVKHFYVPLGVNGDLERWGVAAGKITQFDWWQAERVGDLTLVALPAQHFSGRGMNDGNKTLWCSWALRHGDEKIFYSGDSGYFDQFKRIGEEYGPFDLTLMEAGAYDERWPHVHMRPEDTVQAHIDLRGRQLMPVHNATFRLAFHPWDEPLERVSRIAADRGVTVLTPEIGRTILLGETVTTPRWWRNRVTAPSTVPVERRSCSGRHCT